MSRASNRREVATAQQRYAIERCRWRSRTLALRTCIARDREAWIIIGGLVGGFVAAGLPVRNVARATRLAVGTLSFALRNPVAAALRDMLRQERGAVHGAPDPAHPVSRGSLRSA